MTARLLTARLLTAGLVSMLLAFVLSGCGEPATAEERVREAVAAGDFCALHAGLAKLVLDPSDRDEVVATYKTFGRAAQDASEFVPGDLRTEWDAVVKGTGAAAAAAAANGGDTSDPAFRSLLTEGEFHTAYLAVDDWALHNC